jgi:hypothetical protein
LSLRSCTLLTGVQQRKQMLACPVVAKLPVVVVAARPDAFPARHRHRVTPAAGHEHDKQALKRLRPSGEEVSLFKAKR